MLDRAKREKRATDSLERNRGPFGAELLSGILVMAGRAERDFSRKRVEYRAHRRVKNGAAAQSRRKNRG